MNQHTGTPASSSHESASEPLRQVVSGKHSIHTHFPKDRNCDICMKQIDGVTQNFKSQQACITALALGNALNAEKMLIHSLSWSSLRITRVCRSTLMAEAYALSNDVEH